MTWIAAAVVGSAVVGAWSASKQADAAGDAAQLQADAAAGGVAEQRRQFDALQQLLAPYAQAGQGALSAQQGLIGLAGPAAQQQAIAALQGGPQFQAMQQQGHNAILQNASATGGLRGGNVQSALAQFSPRLLASLIEQQYARLGGITSIGQNAAAMTGNAGMQSGNSIAALLQQQGAAQAGGALAAGAGQAGIASSLGGGLGLWAGLRGFGGFGGAAPAAGAATGPGLTAPAGFVLGGG